jgi:hypothetical protein
MKAVNGFCTWRALAGAATVGALAIAVSVQGSPRVSGERDKAAGKSTATRVVTGPSANINSAIALGGTAIMEIEPTDTPRTLTPPLAYPAGTVISHVTNSITLVTIPAAGTNTWWEFTVTGWAPQVLRTLQGKLDAADADMDGGGLFGSLAGCGGADLTPALYPCPETGEVGDHFCLEAILGTATDCFAGPPSLCQQQRHCVGGPNDGKLCPVHLDPCPGGGTCTNDATLMCDSGYQDGCNSAWALKGIAGVPAADTSTESFRPGATATPPAIIKDYNLVPAVAKPTYYGTLAIHVPPGAKGTYVLDFKDDETFLLEDALTSIPIGTLVPGQIVIPCGKCCFGVGGPAPGCVDNRSKAECDALAAVAIFDAGLSCVAPPGDAGCCACTGNADCDDGDACTTDTCGSCVCTNSPKATWNTTTQCCDSVLGTVTTLGCPDAQCTAASCTLTGNHGAAQCLPTPGASCNDGSPCTYTDLCGAANGACAGSPVVDETCTCDPATEDCQNDSECFLGPVGNKTQFPCVDGNCFCTETPDLNVDIDAGGKGFDPNCFESGNPGEKITGTVSVGPFGGLITGAQIALQYDPSCLVYNGIGGVGPFSSPVYGPVVDPAAGTIFIAVGVGLGNPGVNGPQDIVGFSFIKIGDCNSCNICLTNVNPFHTYLVDDTGQRISVSKKCSKTIKANNDITLTTPGSIKTNVDCDRPTAIETWAAPSATDSCGNSTIYCRGEHESGAVYDQPTVLGGGEFPQGASSFCCYALSDYCGKIVGCPPDTNCALGSDSKPEGCWTVRVNDETSLDLTVGLSPTSQSKPGDHLTRCIKFTLYSNCIQEPLEFCDDVTFGGLTDFVGKSTGKIKIPGKGQWDCITAQDKSHTLRSCYTFDSRGGDCVDGQLSASFSGDPRLGGNWLIGGNLDGWKKCDLNANPSLDVIDILDFGTFVSQLGANYGSGDTFCDGQFKPACCPDSANADINGDGLVDLEDYAFVSMNFLTSSKNCCCGAQIAGVNAVTEISVAQLRAMGLTDIVSADLNGDGVLNLADMAAFDEGVRPTKKASTKDGSRSTGSR